MHPDLTGQTAIITGASRGIGAATALELASRGAAVVAAARTAEPIETLAENIQAAGGKAIAVPCDVSQYAQIASLADTALAAFGKIDILVNNAGTIDPIARLSDSDADAWGRVVDINLKGVYHGLRAVLPVMEAQESGGIIVNISSGAATGALEGWSHYCATKAAVLALTRCAHKEYGHKGITVVGLSPGTVATDMQRAIRTSGINPVSQIDWDNHIPAEWAARAVAYLCGGAGRNFAGTDFSIKTDEGRRLVGLAA